MQNLTKIFVEGDTIVLALDPNAKNVHTSDLRQSGPRLGFISIDELHDPSQQAALKERVIGYYRNIPLEPLKIQALNQNGIYLAEDVIQQAGDNAVRIEGLKRIIAANTSVGESAKIKLALQDSLKRNGVEPEPDPDGLPAALARYATANNLGTAVVINRIITFAASELNGSEYFKPLTEVKKIVREEMERNVPPVERQGIADNARKETFDHLMEFIPSVAREEAWKKFASAPGDKKAEELLELLKTHWVNSDPGTKAAFFDRLADTGKKDGTSLTPFVMPSLGGILSGQQTVSISMVDSLRKIQENPEPHVEKLLQDIHAAGYQPLRDQERETADSIRKDFRASVAQMPDFVRDASSVIDIHAIIGKPGTKVDDIVPSKKFLDGLYTTKLGQSNGTALYLDAKTAASPAIVAEEVLHEVDRAMGWYSSRPEWKAAVDRDCTPGTPPTNKAAQKLLSTLKDENKDVGKTNTCFDRPRYPVETQVEALPDMMHFERIAGDEIAKKGKFRTGLLSALPTVEAVMDSAFPNTGKLYRGPAKGNTLAQHPDGTVVEIPQGKTPSGATEVTAFATACRDFAKARKAQLAEETAQHPIAATLPSGDIESPAIQYRSDWAERFGKKSAAAIVHA